MIGYREYEKMEEKNEIGKCWESEIVWRNSDGRHSGMVGNYSSQNN